MSKNLDVNVKLMGRLFLAIKKLRLKDVYFYFSNYPELYDHINKNIDAYSMVCN